MCIRDRRMGKRIKHPSKEIPPNIERYLKNRYPSMPACCIKYACDLVSKKGTQEKYPVGTSSDRSDSGIVFISVSVRG